MKQMKMQKKAVSVGQHATLVRLKVCLNKCNMDDTKQHIPANYYQFF